MGSQSYFECHYDQMVPVGIEPAAEEKIHDPPLDPAPDRLIAGCDCLCYPFLTGVTAPSTKERRLLCLRSTHV